MRKLAALLFHHIRFYSAVACGLLAYGVARLAGLPVPLLAAGDVFYAVFLILMIPLVARQTPQGLERRAKSNDEGIVIVVLITLATMAFFCLAVFAALGKKHAMELPVLAMAGCGALLGWCVLHTAMAFHYADIYYFDDPETHDDDSHDLEFPGGALPGPWDFLYFSFVVGMTAQVSDVQIKTSVMRRACLFHGVVSFFFNTVFIAMAVNAAVSLAS
jgi:uncharacterized membrane protein